jgi:acetoin utilization protein AcuB
MIANTLFSDAVLPVKTSATGLALLHLMDEYKVSHIPIVNDLEFLGLISEDDIFNQGSFEDPIGSFAITHQDACVEQSQHLFDVLRIFAEKNLTVLPVVDNKRHYLGVITQETIVQKFADLVSINNPGGIIVLEVGSHDFSLSEIGKIIEDNDARVLSLFVTSHSESAKVEVTIKLNKMDIQPLIQTFQRYDYTIKESYFESEYYDGLRDRYDQLMTFLNI